MTDLPTRLRSEVEGASRQVKRARLFSTEGTYVLASEIAGWASLMRAAADEIERLRAAPLAALDTEAVVSVVQVQALADAMWQVLDDMGADSRSVCPATKARARIAYEPFRFVNDDGDDGLDMPLSEAEAILAEAEASPASSPIVKTEE